MSKEKLFHGQGKNIRNFAVRRFQSGLDRAKTQLGEKEQGSFKIPHRVLGPILERLGQHNREEDHSPTVEEINSMFSRLPEEVLNPQYKEGVETEIVTFPQAKE